MEKELMYRTNSYAQVKRLLKGKSKRKLANNTNITNYGSESIYLELHGHHIAEFTNKYVKLSSCGYQTRTTKNRLNMALHLYAPNYVPNQILLQIHGEWYLVDKDGTQHMFVDGIRISEKGKIIK